MKQKLFSSTLGLAFLSMIFPLSADESQDKQIYLSEVEVQEIFSNPTRSYVYVGKDISEIANVISEISKLEEDQNSPVWGLKNHIEKGFSIGNYDAVAQALEQAELTLRKHSDTLDADKMRALSQSLDNIIEQVIEDKLSLDAELLSFLKDQVNVSESNMTRAGLRLLVINEKMHVHGKTKFYKDVTFKDDVKFKDEVTFEDGVSFQDNVTILGTLSAADQIISGGLSVSDQIIGCNLTVGCNISMNDSISPAIGNVIKNGVPFIHNFGTDNTFVGDNSGNFTMTGADNTAMGSAALTSNTSGTFNAAFGQIALVSNTEGSSNTAIGQNSLTANTTGSGNTALGSAAVSANTTGINNTGLGFFALPAITTGSNNIAIGAFAGDILATGDNNIYIGLNAAAAGESNVTRIRNIRGTTTGVADAIAVLIDSTGQLGTVSSTRRVKHAIADMADASANIYNLRPVTFVYNGDASETRQFGLVAEEADQVFPDIVVDDENGQPFTIQYHVLPVLMLNEMKKLAARVAVLEQQRN